MKDTKIPIEDPMKIYCDNKDTINHSNYPILHCRMKYVEVGHNFITETIDSNELALSYVKTSDQVVDVFTKRLSMGEFEKNVDNLACQYVC